MHSNGMEPFGRFFIFVGLLFLLLGAVFLYGKHFSFLGRLPGDIRIERDNFTFYFPLTTSILISLVLSFILYLISRR